jgi:uncharacterized SAM-binding protein YcdF (DUF218 family)
MNRAALMRLIEGIRLQKAIPRTKLVLSGGGKSAETMNAMALSLKIPEENIILETQSSNTYDEVLLLKDMLSEQLFILVTSASHMPRSMALFKHAGLNPIPAPTDHRTSSSYQFKLNELIPSLHSLENFHGAFYEYLAITKEYLLRRI